jgi:hypothetical protein
MPKYLCGCGFVGTDTHNVPIDELENFGVTFFVDTYFHICCGVKHIVQLHVVKWRRSQNQFINKSNWNSCKCCQHA